MVGNFPLSLLSFTLPLPLFLLLLLLLLPFPFSWALFSRRAVVQRCSTVKIYNLLSVGGQHQGVYGFPRCPGENETACEVVRKLLNLGAYVGPVQDM